MEIVSSRTIRDQIVCLDNKHFVDCVLSRCVVEYSGEPMLLERTEFRGCRLMLREGAGRTLHFLQEMGYLSLPLGEKTAFDLISN